MVFVVTYPVAVLRSETTRKIVVTLELTIENSATVKYKTTSSLLALRLHDRKQLNHLLLSQIA